MAEAIGTFIGQLILVAAAFLLLALGISFALPMVGLEDTPSYWEIVYLLLTGKVVVEFLTAKATA